MLLNSLPSSQFGKNAIEMKTLYQLIYSNLNEKMGKKPENQGHALIIEGRDKNYQRGSSNYCRSEGSEKSKNQSNQEP